jgi:CAAX amino terminal protease family.
MKAIIGYLRDYIRSVNRLVFIYITLFTALMVVLNYRWGLESTIYNLPSYGLQFAGFFLLFTFIYSTGWLIQGYFSKQSLATDRFFYVLLLAAPAIFACKTTMDWASEWASSNMAFPWNRYWDRVLNWPLKCLWVLLSVMGLWKWGRYPQPVAGLPAGGFPIRPYLLLLLGMMPLLAFAATQPDFLHTYPRMQRLAFIEEHTAHPFWWKLLFEFSYGIDFITIEFFFRGFLVLALARYAGKDSILPMAAFYCSIHFGKPMLECITSYFGGIVLGVVVYNTRSIWGGLIVHLGIAWLMELAGYLGHLYRGV